MKMEAPKLDIVRFNESDIIVASDIPDLPFSTVYGFNNEVVGDAYVIYNGVTYRDSATLNAALEADGLEGWFQLFVPNIETHSVYDTSDMYYIDSIPHDPGDIEFSILVPDGDYYWNGKCFVHQ